MSLLGGIDALHEALNYHLVRHNLLSSNLAHVDTPGYKPRDLQRVQTFEQVLQTRVARTHAQHLGSNLGPEGWEVSIDENAPIGPNGNGVSLDREAVKIASNNLRYDAIAAMIHGKLSNLTWAAQDGR